MPSSGVDDGPPTKRRRIYQQREFSIRHDPNTPRTGRGRGRKSKDTGDTEEENDKEPIEFKGGLASKLHLAENGNKPLKFL